MIKTYDVTPKDNPCRGCTRPEKKPGCHDYCKYHEEWKAELKKLKEAYKSYKGIRNCR